MQKFIANVSEKAQLQELQIRSDIALFICNKWDEVGVVNKNWLLFAYNHKYNCCVGIGNFL